MSSEWYYVAEGEARGPFPEAEIVHLIRNGEIKGETLVWTEGMTDWALASDHFETRRRFGPPRAGTIQEPAATGPWQAGLSTERAAAGNNAGHAGPDGLYRGAPARGFGAAIAVCLRRYFKFSGRASRSEFWYFVLFGFLASIAAGIADGMLFGLDEETAPLSALIGLALFIPQLSVTFRRLHDTGRSGWWIGWMIFGPFLLTLAFAMTAGTGALTSPDSLMGVTVLLAVVWVGLAVLVFIFLCRRGDPGPNRYS